MTHQHFTNESNLHNNSRKGAKLAKKTLCGLGLHVGQGRKQDAEALRLCERKYSLSLLVPTLQRGNPYVSLI